MALQGAEAPQNEGQQLDGLLESSTSDKHPMFNTDSSSSPAPMELSRTTTDNDSSLPPTTQSGASPISASAPAATNATVSEPSALISTGPTARLGPAFARGWRSLPTELKLRVLSFNLVLTRLIGRPPTTLTSFAYSILHHHAMVGPDFADLAREVFYKENTFIAIIQGSFSHKSSYTPVFIYPNVGVCHFIRRLKVLAVVGFGYWKFLHRLAGDIYGFVNLQELQVSIIFPHDIRREGNRLIHESLGDCSQILDSEMTPPVHFKCRGMVRIIHRYRNQAWPKQDFDTIEADVTRRITFAGAA